MATKRTVGNSKRISRADVAKAVGVAPCTVSLVLNNTPNTRIREKVRQRIRQVADELGYRPSAMARALVTGRTNSIGVLIFQGGNPFDSYTNGVLGTFWTRLHAAKYRLIVDSIEMDENAAEYFIDHAADGVMLVAPPRKIKNLDIMRQAGFPLVCVGNIPDCDNVDYIDLDNYPASKKVTEYLIKQGHTKIVYIAGILEHSSTADARLAGYRDAIKEAGLKYNPEYVLHGEFVFDAGREAIRKFLENKIDFSAVMAAADAPAYGAISELEARGISVPGEISVASIVSLDDVIDKRYELSGIINPLQDIGIAAADILIKRINGAKEPPVEKMIQGELFIGNTVRKI